MKRARVLLGIQLCFFFCFRLLLQRVRRSLANWDERSNFVRELFALFTCRGDDELQRAKSWPGIVPA